MFIIAIAILFIIEALFVILVSMLIESKIISVKPGVLQYSYLSF